MKKILLIVFLLILCTLSFAEVKSISNIDSFKFDAREITILNGKKRIKEYHVIAVLPDKIRKEITFPEENKGEVYIYDGPTKIVYLPLFEQSYKEQLDNEENYIIKVLRDLKAKELSDPQFKKNFYSGNIKELQYNGGLTIKFEKLEKVSNYYFPVKIAVYDNGSLISEVMIKNVTINPTISEGAFTI